MLGRNFCLAVLIAVTVQVVEVHSTVAALSSVCDKAEECYVNETSSKVCNRTEKKCNQCVREKTNDSVFSTLSRTKYICLDVDDNGDCPTGTTKCPKSMWSKLKTSDNEELELEENTYSSHVTDSDESNTAISTFTSTEKELISSSSESKPPIESISSIEATPILKHSSTGKKPSILLSSTDSSGNSPTSETLTKPMLKKTATSTLLASKDEVLQDASTSDYSSSSLHGSTSAFEESNFPSPDSAEDESNPLSSVVAPTATTPAVAKSVTKDTALSNKSDSKTTANRGSEAGGSKLGLILCIGLGVAAVVGVAGFVASKKKTADEKSDDSDAAFSSNTPVMRRNVTSQLSATSASTPYLARPNQYGNNDYEHQYNSYGNNYGGDSGYSNNHTGARYVTGSGAAAGMVPASYGSPCSINTDENYDSRRTDSILGGTGVMLTTTSGMHFSAGPSPANSDTSEVDSVHQKCTASSASVEF
ncbi:unnamed protein product [Peronospora destructor]|uniref:Uncharacterized protein n=1 Tax=Peronospora destructor TaxID=86335 RepID=A0AAV0SYE2_9STRA|nr:unnamed protein product [Peronospora destructor]